MTKVSNLLILTPQNILLRKIPNNNPLRPNKPTLILPGIKIPFPGHTAIILPQRFIILHPNPQSSSRQIVHCTNKPHSSSSLRVLSDHTSRADFNVPLLDLGLMCGSDLVGEIS